MTPYLCIGTPCHSHTVHNNFCASLQQLARSGLNYAHISLGGGGISMARNKIMAQFLKEPVYTHLLFIDSDIEFEPWMIANLISHNLPMVAAPYFCKKRNAGLSGMPKRGFIPTPDQKIIPMAAVGTGFLLLTREAVLKLAEFCEKSKEPRTYWDSEYGRTTHNICWQGVVNDPAHFEHQSYLTEDFGLCYTATLAGITPMLDRSFYVKHYGDIDFPLEDPVTEGRPNVGDQTRAEDGR